MLNCRLFFGALLAVYLCPVAAQDTCPARIPGLPGIPGFPGRDGRDGAKGEKGDAGRCYDVLTLMQLPQRQKY